MTLRPEIEALLQGALDDSLTPEERERLDRLMQESLEVRGRAEHLKQLTELLDSLGTADPPADLADDVLRKIAASSRQTERSRMPLQFSRSSAPKEIAMNKKIMFGLAAAAVLVLAVATFVTNRPASEGTEATIGAAQRYQAPQIEAKDVKVGDTSAQVLMQTETWDQILKDDTLRNALQDPNFRAMLENADLRVALLDVNVQQALRDNTLRQQLSNDAVVRAIYDADLIQRLDNAILRTALMNRAFVTAVRNDLFRELLTRTDFAASLTRSAFHMAMADRGFIRAMRQPQFSMALRDLRGCDEWGCGANSRIVAGANVH